MQRNNQYFNKNKQARLVSSFIILISITLSLTLIFFTFIEVIFFLNFSNPSLSKKSSALHFSSQILYDQYDRNIIQYLPECSKYDPDLFYVLKTGTCTFTNREFSNTYIINSIGVRDDEKSLKEPEIIVVGDSFAMGWGVEQEKTFSSIIEKELNTNVLNAAVSSYGTARELEILKRVDTSNLKYLIIQYCLNDLDENKSYIDNNYKLKISSIDKYKKTIDDHLNRKQYSPFIYSYEHFKNLYPAFKYLNDWKEERFQKSKQEHDLEAKIFLNVLNSFEITKDVQIILFENEYRLENDWFLISVRNLLKDEEYKNLNIIFVSTSDLNPSNYYILDSHLTEKGHKNLSKKLLRAINTGKSDVLYEDIANSLSANFIIEDYEPKEIEIGSSFNIQEDGSSAIWFKSSNLSKYSEIFINDIPLKTYIDNNIATAIIPENFLLKKAKHNLYIKNLNSISNSVILEIK